MIVIGPGVVEWVAKRTNEYGNFGSAVGIGWQRNGKLTCGVVYNDFNGANINMHVASEGASWLTREFLWTVFDYPFNQAKVKRVTALIGEGNAAARRFNEHIGFTMEARLKDAHPTGDLLIYVLKRGDCRWIGHDFGKRYAKAA